MDTAQFIKNIRDLIGRNEIKAAIDLLRQLLDNSPKLDFAIQQSARFQSVREQIRQGTLSYTDATLTQNQITAALLDFLQELQTQGATPELQDEMEKAVSIVNSKNSVVGSTFTAQKIQVGDNTTNIIYQTNPPAAAPPKQIFNQKLTQGLVEAMRPYNEKAEKLCRDFSWLEHPENRRKVQQFVFQNFVGEIGKQLRKLINIGDNDQMEAAKKQQHYVNKCLEIAKRSLDLINFALLSAWWEALKNTPNPLDSKQEKILSDFFEKELELSIDDQFHLLCALFSVFAQQKLASPFDELQTLQPQLVTDSLFHQACTQLDKAVQAEDCEKSEEKLAEIMHHLSFLTQYRMVSLKKIGYRQIRDGKPEYLHRYVALGIDVKYSEDAEKGKWIEHGEQTPAILLFRGEDYQKGLNLFPFVIDYNALTFEHGAKICFFSSKDLNNEDTLEYRFLGDNSSLRIEKKGIYKPDTNLNELMMNPEHLKTLNLDCVVDGFHDARQALLGVKDNFFDSL